MVALIYTCMTIFVYICDMLNVNTICNMYELLITCILVVYTSKHCLALPIDGCPVWGCKSSGIFSLTLNVPKTNATIDWVSDFFIAPVPNAGGCVGNSDDIVCQSNGPGPNDTGYMSIDANSGKVRWRDSLLRFPSLPAMDTHGAIRGSDGTMIVAYDTTGKPVGPTIHLEPNMRPLFDMQLINGDVLLLVSENGNIALLLTDGTPIASLTLRGMVDKDNGTFIPTAPPIVNDVDSRFYVVTEFAPDDPLSSSLGLQRLYAVDVHKSIMDRVTVAWYYNFVNDVSTKSINHLFVQPNCHRRALVKSLKSTAIKPIIMWDNLGQLVLVSLPSPLLGASTKDVTRFYGIRDYFHDPGLVFETEQIVTNIALYETSTLVPTIQKNNVISLKADSQIWVSLIDGKLLAIDRDGTVQKVIDLPKLLQTNCTITSKVMTARMKDTDEDFLIFGIHVLYKTKGFIKLVYSLSGQTNINSDYYLVGLDTSENINKSVAWVFPTPENMPVTGQIIGVASGVISSKDRLVAYAQNKSAGKLFSVVSK